MNNSKEKKELIKAAIESGKNEQTIESLIDAILSGPEKQPYRMREEVIEDAIMDFPYEDYEYDISRLKGPLCRHINKAVEFDNALKTHEPYSVIRKYETQEVAAILRNVYIFKNVRRDFNAPSRKECELMYYSSHGWYEPADEVIERDARRLSKGLSDKQCYEVINMIKNETEIVDEYTHKDWVPLQNGIFCKKYFEENGTLIPYSADKVITSPLAVSFDADAQNPIISINNNGEVVQFDVEAWLLSLANGDEALRDYLWICISSALHVFRRYNKSLLFYSSQGNNGKGTLLKLLENIVGSSNTAEININQFSESFSLPKMMHARLITGNENPVNAYTKALDKYKAAITGDTFQVNMKYKQPVQFRFHGMIIECMNSLLHSKDKSNTLYRRLIAIPFNASFENVEDTDIKDVYMCDSGVLQYVLYKALMLDAQKEDLADMPQAVSALMEIQKESNDTLLQWYEDFRNETITWDRLPFRLLYGIYDYWMKKNTPSERANMTQNKFTREFKERVLPKMEDDGWYLPDNEKNVFRVTSDMRMTPELLIAKYNVSDLFNPNYTGKDWEKISLPGNLLRDSESGIMRK